MTPDRPAAEASSPAWLAAWAGLLVFGLLVAALARPASAEQPPLVPLLKTLDLRGYTSRTAAPQFSGRTLDARQLSITEHRGAVIVLNFWASWCLECRSEMPILERLQREFSSRGFVVIGVNVRENKEAVARYAKELGLTFPLVFDADGKITALYGVIGLPTTFVVGRDGRAVAFAIGLRSWESAPARALIPMTASRGFLLVLGLVLTLAEVTARATEAQAPRLVKIGALTENWGPTPSTAGLRDGLQELGYREDRDFVIGVRFVQGNVAELPEAARALVRHGVDLIVASGENAATAARMATTRIPIVFMAGGDPVAADLVKSFARPGGNITGIADLELELVPKRMEIFHELIPELKRVLLVYDATNAVALSRLKVHRDAAHRLGLTLVERPVRTEDEPRSVIGSIRKAEVDGIFSPRAVALNIPGAILEIAPKRAIPTMFQGSIFVEQAGLASYGASNYGLGRQAARLVDKILKGARPGDVPVEQPTKFELVINLKAAKALGVTIPQSILLRADCRGMIVAR